MAVVDVHLLAQCLLYFCGAICGLCVTVTITVNQANFSMCTLYADVIHADPPLRFLIKEKSKSFCHFPIYWSAGGLVVNGIVKGVIYALAVARSKTNPNTGKEMWVLIYLASNIATGFVTFVVACMISVSFKQFCDGLTSVGKFASCSMAQNLDIKRIDKDETDTTGQFYVLLNVAQVAAWSAFLIWGMLIGLNVLRLIRNRRSVTAIPHTRMEETDA